MSVKIILSLSEQKLTESIGGKQNKIEGNTAWTEYFNDTQRAVNGNKRAAKRNNNWRLKASAKDNSDEELGFLHYRKQKFVKHNFRMCSVTFVLLFLAKYVIYEKLQKFIALMKIQ